MPYQRSPASRARETEASHLRRRHREASRRIVGIDQRRPDDGIIDHIAIDLALRGWTRHGAVLSRAELVEAIRVGTARGVGVPQLADLLCLWEREVQRLRVEGRAGQQQVAA